VSEQDIVVARRADTPGALALNTEADVARSAALVQAAGYVLVPLSRPIGPWAILAVSGHGLLLVSVVRDAWPSTLGSVWGHPAGWPVYTRRLLHRWTADQPLPDALPLG
jgi:hypothetical protein